jgi:hypothetical protein
MSDERLTDELTHEEIEAYLVAAGIDMRPAYDQLHAMVEIARLRTQCADLLAACKAALECDEFASLFNGASMGYDLREKLRTAIARAEATTPNQEASHPATPEEE